MNRSMYPIAATLIVAAIMTAGAIAFPYPLRFFAYAAGPPRVIELMARQFAFTPEVIHVRAGETVVFRVVSIDVTHGVYIDGFDYFVDLPVGEPVDIGPVTFDRPGKFKIRCATLCGPLHPFMVADVLVEPNLPFYLLAGGTLAFGAASVVYLARPRERFRLSKRRTGTEIDLLGLRVVGPIVKRLLQWRGAHFFLILPNLLIFIVVIVSGLFGNPLGALNFSIAVVWILWFAAVEYMIFFGSRIWCTICPLPSFGEWLARRRLVGVLQPRRWLSLNRPWPKRLDNIWIGALGFLGISLIIPWLVTRPIVSAMLFITLISVAVVVHLINPERRFCLHLEPAGAYIGYHASASPFAVRSRDKSICDKHVAKECIRGGPNGYGCPWKVYPGGLNWNSYCGQCFECLRSCPLDNMTLKYRMVGKDVEAVAQTRARADEAWMGFIRFSLAIFYELVFFGPYFWIKDWGNMGTPFGANLASIGLLIPTLGGFTNWLKWVAIVSSIALVVFPAVFLAFSWLARKAAGETISLRRVFLSLSYALSPYGLLLWMAFAIPLVAVNWAYPLRAFSDPMGWGWNLFGTAQFKWRPLVPDLLPFVQAPIVFLGLFLAMKATYRIGLNLFGEHGKAIRATAAMGVLHTAMALLFITLLTG